MLLQHIIDASSEPRFECFCGQEAHEDALSDQRFNAGQNLGEAPIKTFPPINYSRKEISVRMRGVVNSTQKVRATAEDICNECSKFASMPVVHVLNHGSLRQPFHRPFDFPSV